MSRVVSTPLAGPRLRLLAFLPVIAGVLAFLLVATAPAGERGFLAAAAIVAAVAGLSATSIGVFGGVLVPGLLLLGVPPAVAAPLSLLLQVVVIPLGATSHAAVGHVKRSITVPLIIGGVAAASAAPSSPRPCRPRSSPGRSASSSSSSG